MDLSKSISFDWWYYIGLALLVVLMVLVVIRAIREWVEIHDVEEPDTADELLESFAEARAMGVMNEEEFGRVREQLEGGTDDSTGSTAPIVPDEAKSVGRTGSGDEGVEGTLGAGHEAARSSD